MCRNRFGVLDDLYLQLQSEGIDDVEKFEVPKDNKNKLVRGN